MRFACPKCQVALTVTKNGVAVEEMTDSRSYRLWDADLLICPECGIEIISNFGSTPLVEHFRKESYGYVREALRQKGPLYQIWNTRRDKERYRDTSRCDREIEDCREAGRTAATQSEKVGAMQGEVDWMVARQMAEEDLS